MLYPLTFRPIFKERIWGGRNLEQLYHKTLPPGLRIGESWEISDRPGDENIIANGPLQGKSLRWLMENHAAELLGPLNPMPARFPLLIKIIDAQETLSLQVHPPAGVAKQLGGEPKTEMWYLAQAGPKAELFVGLKQGVTRAEFEKKLAGGTAAECVHRFRVKAGDAMFLPSGRIHAIGAEMVIFEIQQNSDTTYRVFDWNRVDAAGKARELHVAQSLASIDFSDVEPALLPDGFQTDALGEVRPLVKHELFETSLRRMRAGQTFDLAGGRMEIIGVVEGTLRLETLTLKAGHFCLVPASNRSMLLQAETAATFLQIQNDRRAMP